MNKRTMKYRNDPMRLPTNQGATERTNEGTNEWIKDFFQACEGRSTVNL